MYSKLIVHKRCFVPNCNSSSAKNQKKDFFYLPKDNIEGWCRAAGYDGTVKHGLQICEDHLNLETDIENYMWWKTMGGPAKLKCEPPCLKNIEGTSDTSDNVKKQVSPKETTRTTIDTQPLSDSEEDIEEDASTVSCDICAQIIFGLRYLCVQCDGLNICRSCATEAHITHYLLRVPENRPEDEVDYILHNLRNLIDNDDFLPTEYLSSDENKPDQNEIDLSINQLLEDEIPRSASQDVNDEPKCDDDNVFYSEDDDVEYLEPSGSDVPESDRDTRKRERLQVDCETQVYLAPENIENEIVKEYGGVLVSKKRNMPQVSNREIWLQHRGRQTQLDNKATEMFIQIVNKKIYQDMFRHGGQTALIWKRIAQEMISVGFNFGTRDPKTVCAQKWRNLEMKAKQRCRLRSIIKKQ